MKASNGRLIFVKTIKGLSIYKRENIHAGEQRYLVTVGDRTIAGRFSNLRKAVRYAENHSIVAVFPTYGDVAKNSIR